MAYRTIKQWPSKILSRVADEASAEEIAAISQDLIDTLKICSGAGLAAPQIGISKRVLVIDTEKFMSENPDKEISSESYWVVGNPVITNLNGEFRWKEACLSVPIVSCMVTRSETLTLSYQDINGDQKTIDLEAPLSLAIQHEADHLEGKTILDRVGRNAAGMYKRKIRKSMLKMLKIQKQLEKSSEPTIGRAKKKSHLSNQERKKRKRIRKINSGKK